MTTCQRQGCANEGTAHPVLLLHPYGHPEVDPVEFILGLVVCEPHQQATTLADLIHPTEGWPFLDKLMVSLAGVPVDHEHVGVAWKHPELTPWPKEQTQ